MESQEYETASDFKEDFGSDNEPPVEKIVEKKLVVRGNLKIYKRILRLGHRGFEKPACFDVVQVRFKEMDAEPSLVDESSFADSKPVSLQKIKALVEDLRNEPLQEVQLGIAALPLNLVTAFSTMKKGEVAFVEFEQIERDAQTKERRLRSRVYYLLEYATGVTVIDMFTDKRMFKIMARKSVANTRVEPSDKMQCALELCTSDLAPVADYRTPSVVTLRELLHELPPPLSSLRDLESALRGMKEGETAFFEFSPELCGWGGTPSAAIARIETYDLGYQTRPGRLYLRAEVSQLFPVTDVFLDGSVLKVVGQRGYTSSKPDAFSVVFFDYALDVNGKTIASTFPEIDTPPSSTDTEELCVQNKFHGGYLFEYSFSKLLQRSLLLMRRGEQATLEVHNLTHLQYGKDSDEVSTYLRHYLNIEDQALSASLLSDHAITLTYRVQMRFFSEGRNNFTISLEQKEEHIQRKRRVVEQLIAQKNYKRALKILKTIQDLCTVGAFDEDRARLLPFMKSAVLNSSLCQWKLGDWQQLRKAARQALQLDPANIKAVYRLCVAEYKSLNFEEALAAAALATEHYPELSQLKQEIECKLYESHQREKEIYKNILQ